MMEWNVYWTRDYTYQYMETCFMAFTTMMEKAGFPSHKNMIFLKRHGNFACYDPIADEKRYWKIIIKSVEDRKKLNDTIKKYFKAVNDYYNTAKKITSKDLSKASNGELIKFLGTYHQKWIDFSIYLWATFNFSVSYSKIVSDHIIKKAEKLGLNPGEYIEYISEPSKKTSVHLLNEELKKGKYDVRELFEKYAWMPWGDMHAKPWTINDLKRYIKDYKPPKSKPIGKAKLIKDLRLTKKETEMVDVNRELAYIRDHRDYVRRRTVYLIRGLYKEIARRAKVSYDDLMYYTVPETVELLKGKKLPVSEIKRRKGDTLMILKRGKI